MGSGQLPCKLLSLATSMQPAHTETQTTTATNVDPADAGSNFYSARLAGTR